MSTSTRLPVPTPVRSAGAALDVLDLAVSRPLREEIVFVALDGTDRAGIIHCVPGPHSPDLVIDIAEIAAHAGLTSRMASLVMASVRPHGGLLPGDIDRWLEASEATAAHGSQLLEWFVIGPRGIECPRDLLGEPERWRQSAG